MSSVAYFWSFIAVAALADAPEDSRARDAEVADGDAARAIAAFEEGQSRFQAAEYEKALISFQRAMVLQPAPELHYNIALCHSRLGDDRQAIESFEQYIDQTDPDDRADVEHLIEEARARLEARTAQAQEASGAANATESLEVVPLKEHRPLVIGGSSLLALGLAVGISGAVGFGVAVERNNAEVEAFNEGRNALTTREAFDYEKKAYRYEALQYASIAVGIAATVGGVAILATGLKRRSNQQERLGGLRISPASGPRMGGVSISGRF